MRGLWFRSMADALLSPAPWGWRLEARLRSWHATTHVTILSGILGLALVALIQMGWVGMGGSPSGPVLCAIALGGLVLIEAIRGAVLVPRRARVQSHFGNLILDLPRGLKADAAANHVRWTRWASLGWFGFWMLLAGMATLRSLWPVSGILLPTLILLAVLIGLPRWTRRVMASSSDPHAAPAIRWPDRHLQALRPYLAPAVQAVLDRLRANRRWTQGDLHALDVHLVPLWKATVAESADPLPCLRALLPALPIRNATNALVDVIQAQKWDLLDALLAELPPSWWKGAGHPEPRSAVGDALLQMSYTFPDRAVRYADRMGPTTWRMVPADRDACQFSGAQAAQVTDRPNLWVFWTRGMTSARWRAQLIREGLVPPSLPAVTLATWLGSPSAILAMAHHLPDQPRYRDLVQGLLEALASCPAMDRLALIPTVQPYLADRPSLQARVDAVVAQCPAQEQVQWQEAAPDLAWDRTRSGQRLATLASRPASPAVRLSRARI